MTEVTEGILDQLEPIPAWYGFTVVFVAMFTFEMLNRIVASYHGQPENNETSWQQRNLLLSWMHTLIIAPWDLSCVYLLPEMGQSLVSYFSTYSYTLVAFSAGYFCYDFIDNIVNRKPLKGWLLTVGMHHIVVASVFLYNIAYCNCIGYTVVSLLTEVNTFFLHSRKLLQNSHYGTENWFYRVVSMFAILSFIFCRFGVHFGIIYGLWMWSDMISVVFAWLLSITMVVMLTVDAGLFGILIRNDILRPCMDKRKGKSHSSNNNVKENGVPKGSKSL